MNVLELILTFICVPDLCYAKLQFRKQNTTYELSEMLAIGTQVDNTMAVDTSTQVKYPVKYGIIAGNDNTTFNINQTSGVISLAKNMDREDQEMFHLIKTAHIKNGSASMTTVSVTITITVLDVNDNPPVCPQHLIADVREIALVGEVVLALNCKDADKTENSASNYKIVSSQGVPAYFPFTVSAFGSVVVKTPLAYIQGSSNVFNFEVEVKNKKPLKHYGNVNDSSVTNVTVNIKKTDCNTNWIYEESQNTHLNNSNLVIQNMSEKSLDHCKDKCRSLSHCHSIDFEQSSNKCLLTTATVYTTPNAFLQKPGHTLYRKDCNTEPLPSPFLRSLYPKLNASQGTDTAMKLLQFLDHGGDKTSADVRVAADALLLVMKNALANKSGKENYVLNLIEIINECISKLLEPRHITLWKAGLKFGHQPIALLETIEMMTDFASTHLGRDLNILAKHSALLSYNNTSQFVNISLQRESGVCIPEHTTDIASANTRLAVGALEGLDSLLVPTVEINGTIDQTGVQYITGHILSISSFPYFRPPIILDIYSKQVGGKDKKDTIRKCIFLHNRKGNVWKTEGCKMVLFNETHTRCECNHLTNFAILMQVQDFEINADLTNSLETLTFIGCTTSVASLVVTIVALIYLNLKSHRYILLMNLSVSLILAQVTFMAGVHATNIQIVCRMVAILLHYLYLSVFTLMLAEGIQMYNKVFRPFAKDTNFSLYLCLGWGAPVVIVCISLATDFNGYGTPTSCWLSTAKGTIWAFVGPVLTVITINTVILIMVIRTFLGVRVIAKKSEREKYKSSVKAAAVLLPLLGVTWTFGVLAINADTVIFQYIFALLNSVQGVFILLFHVVLNEDVKVAIRRRRKSVVDNVQIQMDSHTDITSINTPVKVNTSQSENKIGSSNEI